ncbi:hypothetical protein, partial [Ralstonia solanacearum]|uniref:hypothetical protein n=1 Tax=Ralstonia solanacearum TaxID=305 RepID=UPI001E4E728A
MARWSDGATSRFSGLSGQKPLPKSLINKGDRHASDIIQRGTAPLNTIGSNERRDIDAHTDARFVNQTAAAAQCQPGVGGDLPPVL